MTEETTRLKTEFDDVTARVRALVARTDDATLHRRPGAASWSAAECVEHLSVTADRYARRITRALDGTASRPPGPRSRHTLWGRFWLWLLEPPLRRRLKVPPPFAPNGAPLDRAALLERFDAAHAALVMLVESTDAIDRTCVKVQSPSSKYIRLSVFDAFAILASHGRRHLIQAERAAGNLPPITVMGRRSAGKRT
jgi:DinB superfamily